jgi:hypothetical protein
MITIGFEYLTFRSDKLMANTEQDLDVLEFAKSIHNETLFKIFELYGLAYECLTQIEVAGPE